MTKSVAAGAVANQILLQKGIKITAYTIRAAGISAEKRNFEEIEQNNTQRFDEITQNSNQRFDEITQANNQRFDEIEQIFQKNLQI